MSYAEMYFKFQLIAEVVCILAGVIGTVIYLYLELNIHSLLKEMHEKGKRGKK